MARVWLRIHRMRVALARLLTPEIRFPRDHSMRERKRTDAAESAATKAPASTGVRIGTTLVPTSATILSM